MTRRKIAFVDGDEGFLEVSSLHAVHYEQVGNPKGKKALFLHGGPGSGSQHMHRRLFDPRRFHAILFDQRGSGRSTPKGALARKTVGGSNRAGTRSTSGCAATAHLGTRGNQGKNADVRAMYAR